jgi:hypothetical protein
MTVLGRPPHRAVGDASSRLGARRLIVVFAIVLGAILLLAAIGAVLSDAPEPPPECQPGTECGGPPGEAGPSAAPGASLGIGSPPPVAPRPSVPPGTVGIRAGKPWTSTDLGFEFEYSRWWAVDSSDGRRADLAFQGPADALLIVAAVPADEATPEAYADRWADTIKAEAPDLRVDSRDKNAILGPMIGFVDGLGRTYAGSWSTPQAATEPIGVSLLTATDGRITVAVVVVVWNPDERIGSSWVQHAVRGTAELALKTFRWGPT